MYVNYSKKLAFICHPRTASVAISHLLRERGWEDIAGHHNVVPEICKQPNWTIACVLRNVFDILVSWYFWHRHFEGTFQEFLFWFKDNPNLYTTFGLFYGLPYSNHILRFENLQDDFNEFLIKVNLEPIKISLKNVTERRKGRSWHEFYKGVVVPEFKICDSIFHEEPFPVHA